MWRQSSAPGFRWKNGSPLSWTGWRRGGSIIWKRRSSTAASSVRNGLTTQRLSQRTGRSVQTVRRKIRLLNLGEEVCALLRHYDLSESIGEALLRMPGQQGRLRVLRHVVELGLDTKGTETLVDGELARMPLPMTSGRRMKPLMRDYRLYLNAIREIVEQMPGRGPFSRYAGEYGRRGGGRAHFHSRIYRAEVKIPFSHDLCYT